MQRLTIDQQTEALEEKTTFSLNYDLPWEVLWVGEVKPFDVTYQISISLVPSNRMKFKHAQLYIPTPNPSVVIESPDVELSLSDALKAHFFYKFDKPSRSPLCLSHYSKGAKWSEDQYIADTIVPWIIQHLAAYEVWEDTGFWNLPEEHPRSESFINEVGEQSNPKLETEKSSEPPQENMESLANNKFNLVLLSTSSRLTIERATEQYD